MGETDLRGLLTKIDDVLKLKKKLSESQSTRATVGEYRKINQAKTDVDSKTNSKISEAGATRLRLKSDSEYDLDTDSQQLNKGIVATIQNKLETAIREVQFDINRLKQDLVQKAFEINKELQSSLARHHSASGSVTSAPREQAREDLFERLLEVQDAPLPDQLKVVTDALQAGTHTNSDGSGED